MDLLSLSLDDIAKKNRAAEKIKAANSKKGKAPATKKTVTNASSNSKSSSKKKKHAIVNPNAKTMGGAKKSKTTTPLTSKSGRAPLKTKGGGSVLVVFSNLEKHISERDVRDFLDRKKIDSVKMFPGRNGNVAEVRFKTKGFALQAIDDFDDRLLDDRKMRVKISTRASANGGARTGPPAKKSTQKPKAQQQQNAKKKKAPKAKNPSTAAAAPKKQKEEPKTTEELDGDMDDYFKKK